MFGDHGLIIFVFVTEMDSFSTEWFRLDHYTLDIRLGDMGSMFLRWTSLRPNAARGESLFMGLRREPTEWGRAWQMANEFDPPVLRDKQRT